MQIPSLASAQASLPEFLNTCVKFCVSDVVYLHELAFKLISRHGSTLSLASGTLEEMDVNDIITQRYKDTGMTQMQIQKIARAVFLHIDDDASGGCCSPRHLSRRSRRHAWPP